MVGCSSHCVAMAAFRVADAVGSRPGVLLFGVSPGGMEKIFPERQDVDATMNKKLMAKYHMEVIGPPIE